MMSFKCTASSVTYSYMNIVSLSALMWSLLLSEIKFENLNGKEKCTKGNFIKPIKKMYLDLFIIL